MGASMSLEEHEAELDKAIQELEGQEQAQPDSVARALSLLKSWQEALIKGKADEDDDEEKTDKKQDNDDERTIDDLLEEYGLNDEDEEPEDEEEEEDEEPAVRKSFYDTALEDPSVAQIIDADPLIAGLLKSFSTAHEAEVRELGRELREMRKALVALGNENKALREELEGLGKRPAGAVPGNYRVRDISKGASPGGAQFPAEEEAMKLAAAAIRKGMITAAERRQIELAYQAGRPELAAEPLFKARQAGDADNAR